MNFDFLFFDTLYVIFCIVRAFAFITNAQLVLLAHLNFNNDVNMFYMIFCYENNYE